MGRCIRYLPLLSVRAGQVCDGGHVVPELAHHLALVGVLLQLHVEEKNLKMIMIMI